ncbi:MAG: ABC transporter permease [Anaerolineae bacterium]
MDWDTVRAVLAGILTVFTLQATLRYTTPIALAALTGIWSERSGIINIGIEGQMLFAACTSYMGSIYWYQATQDKTQALIVGTLVGLLTSFIITFGFAVVAIKFKTDQIIAGTVVNILAVGTTGYLYRSYLAVDAPISPGTYPPMGEVLAGIPVIGVVLGGIWNAIGQIPIIGQVFFQQQPVVVAMLILIVLTHYLLFFTPWGLRTRAVGEHPRAADTAGINVNRMRYADVLAASLIAGLGGIWFSMETVGVFNPNMTNGIGFIGLAAMIFGKWTPFGALGAALLFAVATAIQPPLQMYAPQVPYQFLSMIPYILTIIVLAGAVGRARPPAAEGKPYEHA